MASIESDSISSLATVVAFMSELRYLTASNLSGLWSAIATTRQSLTFGEIPDQLGPNIHNRLPYIDHVLLTSRILALTPVPACNRLVSRDVLHLISFHFRVHGQRQDLFLHIFSATGQPPALKLANAGVR